MKFEECIKRIDRYLRSIDSQPRFVNLQNTIDIDRFKQHFHVGNNNFIQIEDYAKKDENPSMDFLLHDLYNKNGVVFLTGVTSHLRLFGEIELRKQLSQLINLTSLNCHIVVLCYQCEKQLLTLDIRFERIIYMVDGRKTDIPKMVFFPPEMPSPTNIKMVDGIQKVSTAVETELVDVLYVKTRKHKSAYPLSLYHLTEQNSAFEVLCKIDFATNQLDVAFGTNDQWATTLLLREENGYTSWAAYIRSIFGSCSNLELVANHWHFFDDRKKWLYFIALKLYGAPNSWCLSIASKESKSESELVKNLFRSILAVEWNDVDFWNKYTERKNLLMSFGNPTAEVLDYCTMVKSRYKYGIYYLTDSTQTERSLILENLDNYALEFEKDEIVSILKNVYPDIYDYLLPFRFESELLNDYFQTYKYQKVINKIFPEFLEIVEEQAKKREFNLLLPFRAAITEAIDKKDTHLYFIDAMGVEYLGFIMEKCRQKGLLAFVTVCKCELPSITFYNKEFIEVFENAGAILVPDKNGIKSLDDIKHHGQDDYDYRVNSLPLHLMRELEIIEEILEKIQIKLVTGKCSKAVMISDHGASRLSVISNNENKWEMATKGKNSGRCCPKDEINECPTCATEENGHWVLANYDRFKGSRKANVEVHGGATLEEVTIPIIEITYSTVEIEVQMCTPFIEFNKMKKNAMIRLFSKSKLSNVVVSVVGEDYKEDFDVETSDGQTFFVELSDLRKIGDYVVDVYSNNNIVASNLKFTASKEGLKENKLL